MEFDKAFEVIIGHEGGYVNDPRDPGGETKYGISKRSYPNVDIKNLTIEQAKEIYLKDFWDKCKCSQIRGELRLTLFDMAVNQGTNTAIKCMQSAVNVSPDGIIGPTTLKRVNDNPIKETLLNITSERIRIYTITSNFNTYGKGWIRRALKTAFESLA
jgi:lysozyme family protein